MRRLMGVVVVLALALPAVAFAGDVYGVISAEGKVAGGAVVTFARGGGEKKVRANAEGVYKVYLGRGTYRVSVTHGGASSNQVDIEVSATSRRTDLELERAGDRWRLRVR